MYRLRAGKGIQSTKKEHRCLSTSYIPGAIVHILASTGLVMRRGALRVVDLDTTTIMRSSGSRCYGLVERGSGRRAMRGRWRHLYVGEALVHKFEGVIGARKLGKSEALGNTFENPTAGQTSIRVRRDKYEWECA